MKLIKISGTFVYFKIFSHCIASGKNYSLIIGNENYWVSILLAFYFCHNAVFIFYSAASQIYILSPSIFYSDIFFLRVCV